ncbi:MAG: REP-associated tyrosine transposase [Gaiellaceae bacterium]
MARSIRLFVPNGIYHVASRGSDRRPLFLFDFDREAFLDRLGRSVERHEIRCLAYCLMGNHYHLIVQTPDSRLSLALRELNGGYSRRFNRVHGHTAHLFQNRFLAQLVDDETYLLTVCRYVAYNPVRAGLCAEPSEWPWSSYRASAGIDPAPRFLNETVLSDSVGGGREWRRRYRDYVELNRPEGFPPGDKKAHF